jgi:hypothetical protein
VKLRLRTVSSLRLTGLLTLGSDLARFQAKPPACYRASWQLPGPDFHRQATTSLRTARSAATSQRHLPLCWAHERPRLSSSRDRQHAAHAADAGRGLLRCGLVAGPVFATAFLLEGAVRDGYRPLRHPVSSLALGPGGWIQAANFAVTGTLFLAGAAGLSRAGDPATHQPSSTGPHRRGRCRAYRRGRLPYGPGQWLPAGNARCAPQPQPGRHSAQSGGHPCVPRPARRRARHRLAILAERPAGGSGSTA